MDSDPGAVLAGVGAVFFVLVIIGLLLSLAVMVFMIYCWWRIMVKAGYAGPMAFLMLVPFGGLILTCWLAFGRWPALQELEERRSRGV
ncbi:MAG TPA: hypothetical protein PK280_10280 [Planctomycetota bacterium]|nr:hypothetical protein [Planctomycetota bacterium]